MKEQESFKLLPLKESQASKWPKTVVCSLIRQNTELLDIWKKLMPFTLKEKVRPVEHCKLQTKPLSSAASIKKLVNKMLDNATWLLKSSSPPWKHQTTDRFGLATLMLEIKCMNDIYGIYGVRLF